ncbi:MAG: hypothetical protein MMC33_007859 [Icmadophila ericetorum]|nr:hypothetical protein [Icmadophila ericetorum]
MKWYKCLTLVALFAATGTQALPVEHSPHLLRRQVAAFETLSLPNITVSGSCGASYSNTTSNSNTTITPEPKIPDWALPTVHHSRRTKRVDSCSGSTDSPVSLDSSASLGMGRSFGVMLDTDWQLPGQIFRGGWFKRSITGAQSVARRWFGSNYAHRDIDGARR